jgi:sulfate adenylyltransferase
LNNSNGIPKPHGGALVNRVRSANSGVEPNDDIPSLDISADLRNDVENIADGVFSPLEGFVAQDDFQSILKHGRLKNGLAWTIPIILDVDKQTAQTMKDFKDVYLREGGDNFGILHVEDIYPFDKRAAMESIYQTSDIGHPGVNKMTNMKDWLVGGKIEVIKRIPQSPLRAYRMHPTETRSEITKRGWKTIVGFQTRNVPHIAHEMLQKAALNIYDGLFISPLIGKKKPGDFRDEIILAAYKSLMENYYPKDRAMFVTLHTEMRYAGPREAIHHAIMRKNFGCSHFIVGRDHAGVGDYYHPFAAHEIFKEYPDLDIRPVFFPSFYYCKKCLSYANDRNCPHDTKFKEELKGTNIRKMVSSGVIPPIHLMRPEVVNTILSYKEDAFVK